MIYSMTGYGKATIFKNKTLVDVEVKSVNSRFFEIALKLPSILSPFDYEIRELVKAKIQRGKVSLILHFKRDGVENGLHIDLGKLSRQLSLIKKIKKVSGIKEDIKLEHLLSIKEIFLAQDSELNKSEFELVKLTLNKALDKLISMKIKEGAELAKDLSRRVDNISGKIKEVQKEFKKSISDYRFKLKQRIQELAGNVELNEDRLNIELALIADRADITEECVRLKSHLKFFKDSLRNEKEPGKKLNFLCQEMNREANTISSKSISTSIIHTTVLIKDEIEKIREQIQNIE